MLVCLTIYCKTFIFIQNKIPYAGLVYCCCLIFALDFFCWRPKLMDHSERNNLSGKIQINRLWVANVPMLSLALDRLSGMEKYPPLLTCFILRKAVCHCLPRGTASLPILPLTPGLSTVHLAQIFKYQTHCLNLGQCTVTLQILFSVNLYSPPLVIHL